MESAFSEVALTVSVTIDYRPPGIAVLDPSGMRVYDALWRCHGYSRCGCACAAA